MSTVSKPTINITINRDRSSLGSGYILEIISREGRAAYWMRWPEREITEEHRIATLKAIYRLSMRGVSRMNEFMRLVCFMLAIIGIFSIIIALIIFVPLVYALIIVSFLCYKLFLSADGY